MAALRGAPSGAPVNALVPAGLLTRVKAATLVRLAASNRWLR